MVTKELSEVAVEINSIFENMSIDLLNKIPQNCILVNHMSHFI